MKKYEKVAQILTGDPDEFLDRISARIDEYQLLGLQVEIQYKELPNKSCALILGYKEVKKL